ncbi:MAG: hypothetical protein FJ213_12640 [Ignavibacteria bacterium]|nr:hypothetical protein [Ignavibacteria bacterium]
MLDAKIIKESFDPKLITALFKNFSNPYIALFELLDNAVDDRIDGEKLIVSIDYDPGESKLIIKNFNGKGMSIDDLEKFFTWGHSEKRTGRIGRYGQGGKAALGYLAKSFIIKSHPKNALMGYCVRVKDWENRDIGFTDGFEVDPYKSLRDQANVIFEISNMKKEFTKKNIIDRIKKTYRPLITKNKVEFIVDGELVKCNEILYDKQTYKRFKIDFDLIGEKYSMTGEYGIVPDTTSERGGFKIYQYGRNVAEKEYFGHIDPSKRWNVERLYGELYIDFDLPLSMNKSEIDTDSELWININKKMHDELEDIIHQAIDYKTPTKKETQAIKKLKEKISKTDSKDEVGIDLTNYGPKLLYKVEIDDNGKKIIKINRGHKAYIKWCKSAAGKKFYITMICALAEAVEKLSHKEAAKVLNEFSNAIRKKSNDLL